MRRSIQDGDVKTSVVRRQNVDVQKIPRKVNAMRPKWKNVGTVIVVMCGDRW
jgi:hypothetical protein